MEGLLAALVGWPDAEVTAVVGLAALGGTAAGEGVVETFFLGAILVAVFGERREFLDLLGVVAQWVVLYKN